MNRKYWIVRPSEEQEVSAEKAHLSYRVSNGHLLRSNLPLNTQGGWMAIDRIDGLETLDYLLSEIPAECARFGYKAVLFSLPDQLSKQLIMPFDSLSKHLSKRGLSVIVPQVYAPFCGSALLRVSSAISGGSLRLHLGALCHKYGAKRLVLEHPLTRMEFHMPTAVNHGKKLSKSQLQDLLCKPDVQPFYSPELCLNYCTYRTTDHSARFLLFDDARSLSAKIQLGDALGIKYHLLLYYESKDFYESF